MLNAASNNKLRACAAWSQKAFPPNNAGNTDVTLNAEEEQISLYE